MHEPLKNITKREQKMSEENLISYTKGFHNKMWNQIKVGINKYLLKLSDSISLLYNSLLLPKKFLIVKCVKKSI